MTQSSVRSDSVEAPVIVLRSHVPAGVFAAGSDPLRLTWRVDHAPAGAVQEAYEVEASEGAGFDSPVASSGIVESAEQVAVPAPGGPLTSREVRYFRVRIQTENAWTPWSESLRVEAGLLETRDRVAQAITLPDDPGREHTSPSPLLRREFELPAAGIRRARLYATSLGLYELVLNGQRVGDSLLSPGWTAYRHRLVADTYDVTDLLRHGDNVVLATLGDGWWRGRLGCRSF